VLFGIIFKSDRGPEFDPPIIERVLPDSPAAQAGLKADDRIDAMVDFDRRVPIRTVQEARKNLVERIADGQDVVLTTATDSRRRTLSLPPRSQPVHPTQIYASIDAVVLALFLLALDPFCRRDGALFAAMLTLHPISRFLLEIVRIDESAVFHTGLSISQNISILLFVAAAVMWVYVLSGPPRRSFAPR
jgi:phosphatidylglycerol:prolipoprotein diacylglycerol transferase